MPGTNTEIIFKSNYKGGRKMSQQQISINSKICMGWASSCIGLTFTRTNQKLPIKIQIYIRNCFKTIENAVKIGFTDLEYAFYDGVNF